MALLFLLLILAGTSALFWAYFYERKAFQINRHEVRIKKKLPHPIRILHLSDIHFASKPSPYDAFFDRLAKEPVDYVVVTGDIIDCEEGISGMMHNFKKLNPKKGFYAVFGNHDFYDYRLSDVFCYNWRMRGHPRPKPRNMHQVDLLAEALVQSGVKVLRNESHIRCEEGSYMAFHGVDDPVTGHAQVEKITKNFDPQHVNFLLTHTVDLFYNIGEGQIDIAFSGHSHGGQICVPGYGAVVQHTTLGKEFVSGLKRLKGAICCISRGVGTSRHVPLRFLAAPEAIVLNVHGV